MTLSEKSIQGVKSLGIRQAIGIPIHIIGTLILTINLGSREYGIYAASLGVFAFFYQICQWGSQIYFIRQKDFPDVKVYGQLIYINAIFSILIALIGIVAYKIGAFSSDESGIVFPVICMLLLLPFFSLSVGPIAVLEKSLDYGKIARFELLGQLVFYISSIALSFILKSHIALLYGWIAQQSISTLLYVKTVKYKPNMQWDREIFSDMLSNGFSFSLSSWVWQLKLLVPAIIVAPIAGTSGVTYIALGARFIEALSFLKGIVYRISISAFSKIDSKDEIARSLERISLIQALSIALPIIIFNYLLDAFGSRFFNADFKGLITLFPYLAVSQIFGGIFNLFSSSLYSKGENKSMLIFHMVYILIFYVSSFAAIKNFGYIGYGYAEIVSIPAYFVLYWIACKRFGKIRFNYHIIVMMILAACLFLELIYSMLAVIVAILLSIVYIKRHMKPTKERFSEWETK